MARAVARFFWLLKRMMYSWVVSYVFPEDLSALGIDPDRPVCYVIRSRAVTDLAVLDHHCLKAGLPRPLDELSQLGSGRHAPCIWLFRRGLIHQRRTGHVPPQMKDLVAMVAERGLDVQLVPVSIFWGRNPGREEKSLLKLLFFDDENGGILQRLFTFVIHGRNVVCRFGKPIDVLPLVEGRPRFSELARKLSRMLKVHFRRQREAVLGPEYCNRQRVIAGIIASRTIQDAIASEAVRKKATKRKMEYRARSYLEEIAAAPSFRVVRFFEVLLNWLWRRVFSGVEVYHQQRVQELSQRCELIYVPCHRSHMDYLLMGYTTYHMGLKTPLTAAGVNLNFWPVGGLIRRAGAFFIRRTFGGDRLYSAVFSEYVHYLITTGYPLSFYPEGGRSRTGRIMKPKTGMLSMVVQSALRGARRPIALVPVYIGYDKLMEGKTYLKELGGRAKTSESIGQLFKARRILRSEFGSAHINFGEPIVVDEMTSAAFPRKPAQGAAELRGTKEYAQLLNRLSRAVMVQTNNATVLAAPTLIAVILLAAPNKALAETELLRLAAKICLLLERCPYGPDVVLPQGDLAEALRKAEKLLDIKRFGHSGGDILYVSEADAGPLCYYRNNVIHLFALPSLLAAFFVHNVRAPLDQVIARCLSMYRFIRQEMYLPWDGDEVEGTLRAYVQAMADLGLLTLDEESGDVVRPDLASQELADLRQLSRVLGQTIERYAIYSGLLFQRSRDADVEKKAFAAECREMSQRLSILNGIDALDFFDQRLFDFFIDSLREFGHLELAGGEIRVHDSLAQVWEGAMWFLSADLRDSSLAGGGPSLITGPSEPRPPRPHA